MPINKLNSILKINLILKSVKPSLFGSFVCISKAETRATFCRWFVSSRPCGSCHWLSFLLFWSGEVSSAKASVFAFFLGGSIGSRRSSGKRWWASCSWRPGLLGLLVSGPSSRPWLVRASQESTKTSLLSFSWRPVLSSVEAWLLG